jgi:uncharacterized protein YgfB (UPF0149 family)
MSNALSQKSDLEQIADQLTQSADAMNEGVKVGISNNTCTQEMAYSILHDEQALRSRANAIYMDAVQCVVSGLTMEQDELVKVIQKANDTLRTMAELNKFLCISADMIALASAIYAAQPAIILAAVGALKSDIGD